MHTVASELSTSRPIEEDPPSELPPIHEILSSNLTLPFTRKEPHPPEAASSSSEADTWRGFEDLVVVLSEISARGSPTPQLSTVFSLWKDRKPDMVETVGAAQFKAHLQLAESAGIIAIEQRQDGDGRVTLYCQWNTNSESPLPHSGSSFHDLIQVLNDLRLTGDPEPQFFIVGPRLLRKNPSVYQDAGVTKFEEYVKAAAEAGVITVRGVKNGDGLVKLCPAYCSPPARPSTHTSDDGAPPTHANSATSPFTPLVEFLQSEQMTSGQPISYSKVFAHLVSALGYADFVSLCTCVPGVATFGQYVDAAIASGLVSLVSGTTATRDALISLPAGLPGGPSPPTQQSASTTPPPSRSLPPASIKGGEVDPKFVDLVETLGELWKKGNKKPLLSSVGCELFKDVRKRTAMLKACGASNFKACAELAEDAGIIEICGQGAKQTMSLDPTIRVKAGFP